MDPPLQRALLAECPEAVQFNPIRRCSLLKVAQQPAAITHQPAASSQCPADIIQRPAASSGQQTSEAVPAAFVTRQRGNSPRDLHGVLSALSLAWWNARSD